MKECAYCGRENDDQAVHCSECGTDEFKTDAPAGADDRLSPQDELVTLIRCERLSDADLVVSRLETAGIEAFIPDEFLAQTIGFNLNTYGYVRVLVHRKDYESAKALVAKPAEPAKPESSAAGNEIGDPRNGKLCVACSAAIPESSRVCPKCGWTQPDLP